METPLIALAAVAVSTVVSVVLVLSGWLPRLAARAAYVIELLLEARGQRSKLSAKERAELAARLWVSW